MKDMERVLLIIVSFLFLISCDNRTEEQIWKDYQAKQEKARQDSIFKGFDVIVIDSCEYLIKRESQSASQRGYGFMSHKGNCKFCEERKKIAH